MTKWSLSKPKRQRRRNGTNKWFNDPEQWHVRYKSWYMSLSTEPETCQSIFKTLTLPCIFIFQIVPTVIDKLDASRVSRDS